MKASGPVRSTAIVLFLMVLPMGMLYTLWGNPVSAGEDDVVYYYPLRKMVADQLRQGKLPVYNPREATGMPLMADPQTAVLHPTTWLFVVLEPKLAYSLSLFAAFALAGGGSWLYLRRLGLVRPAAMLGAIAFMFCGFMVGHRVHQSMVLAAAMLSWGLWCIEGMRGRGRTAQRLSAGLWMAATVFLTIAAGHWPTLVHMGLTWFVYMLLRGRPLVSTACLAAAAMALAGAMAGPQLHITAQLLGEATRQKIGYAVAGENSFLPTSAALAFFPFLMGSRTHNFFQQNWWGSWHLCEMLGYVGLLTLVLAGACVLRLYRTRPRRGGKDFGLSQGPTGALHGGSQQGVSERERSLLTRDALDAPGAPYSHPMTPLVRCWTWIAIGAGIFMMGYYLPTYRFLHMIPVLGVVRCPARMILAVDLALASLAAIAVHAVLTSPSSPRVERLKRTARTLAVVVLPTTMAVILGAFYAAAWALQGWYQDKLPQPFEGGPADVIDAVKVLEFKDGRWLFDPSPAVYIPLILMGLTAVLVVWWTMRSGKWFARGLAIALVLLLGDLFFITRFVDVPPASRVASDPDVSAAGDFLRQHDPRVDSYRVFGLSTSYHDRPNELLLPKTCESLGFATIANYGPFQSPYHPELFGFRTWGYNRYWAALIRRNHLLSLYGVKYILAAEPEFRRVIESVRIPKAPAPADGPNLLSDKWATEDSKLARRLGVSAQVSDGVVRLRTPFMWWLSQAWQEVKVKPDTVYRIRLDARGPQGGAALFMRAELVDQYSEGLTQHDELGLTAEAEQIPSQWVHLEWTFKTYPLDPLPHTTLFRLFTIGERPIEVRNASLRSSHLDRPTNLGGRLRPGEPVYRKIAQVQAANRSDSEVSIYENMLCQPMPLEGPGATVQAVEAVKFLPENADLSDARAPDISLKPVDDPSVLLSHLTVPTMSAYALVVVLMLVRRFRKRRLAQQ